MIRRKCVYKLRVRVCHLPTSIKHTRQVSRVIYERCNVRLMGMCCLGEALYKITRCYSRGRSNLVLYLSFTYIPLSLNNIQEFIFIFVHFLNLHTAIVPLWIAFFRKMFQTIYLHAVCEIAYNKATKVHNIIQTINLQ